MLLLPSPNYNVSKIELFYKNKTNLDIRVNTPHEAYNIFMNNWDDGRIDLLEEGKVLYLGPSNKVISLYELSRGGVCGTVMEPKHIILGALQQNASKIVLAHNHPSGNLKPSQADNYLTEKINQATKFFDLKLVDHIVLCRHGFYSFSDDGLIP